MATVNVTLNYAHGAYGSGAPMPVFDAVPIVAESITSSGTASTTTGAAPSKPSGRAALNMLWRVVSDGPIWVAFGASPTAAAGTSHFVPSGSEIHVVAEPEHKVSVIDA